MVHLIPISGGKDSQATAIWFSNNVTVKDTKDRVVLVFCDTGNEAPETYQFIMHFVARFPGNTPLEILKNKRGETLVEQAERKGRFPSKTRRFCTVQLKVEPMIDFVLQQIDNVTIYDGRRRQESPQRSKLNPWEDFFEMYIDPEPGKTLYRRKEVKKWIEIYECNKFHPILTRTTVEVFKYITENGYTRNPLYDKGFTRVGCFPCIICNLAEVVRVADHDPVKIDAIRKVEQEAGTTFFGPDKIPVRFCKNKITNDKGILVGAPTIDEVIQYARDRRHTDGLFEGTCLNKYVNCE